MSDKQKKGWLYAAGMAVVAGTLTVLLNQGEEKQSTEAPVTRTGPNAEEAGFDRLNGTDLFV